MIKSIFSELISDPSKIGTVDIAELQKVTSTFPYCQPAHMLLARKLKLEDSMLFEQQLNLSAAYAPSRKMLFNLIHVDEVGQTDLEATDVVVEPAQPTGSESSIDTEDKKHRQGEAKDELDRLIESEAAASQDYMKEEAARSVEKKKSSELQARPEDSRLSFTDWVRYFDGKRIPDLPTQDEIVERFITTEPRIPESKKEVPTRENLARKSSEDEYSDLVTETLARIHLEQGNKNKAIEIYERLKLKYPEKSTYFAAQIQFLKQK